MDALRASTLRLVEVEVEVEPIVFFFFDFFEPLIECAPSTLLEEEEVEAAAPLLPLLLLLLVALAFMAAAAWMLLCERALPDCSDCCCKLGGKIGARPGVDRLVPPLLAAAVDVDGLGRVKDSGIVEENREEE